MTDTSVAGVVRPTTLETCCVGQIESSVVGEGSSSIKLQDMKIDTTQHADSISPRDVGIVTSGAAEEWKLGQIFVGNWADEVEKEYGPEEVSTGASICSQQVVRKKRTNSGCKKPSKKKKKTKKKKAPEYKLFVGGMIFSDLEERLFEMEESIGEEVAPEIMFAALETLKKLRIDCFESIFEEFGKVKSIKPNWEKRFCHVVYGSQEAALDAFQVLAHADERKKRQREFRDILEAAGFPRFAAPKHSFYVRFPRGSEATAVLDVGAVQQEHGLDKEEPSNRKLSPVKKDALKRSKSSAAVSATTGAESQAEDHHWEANNTICYWMTTTSPVAQWTVFNKHSTTNDSNTNTNDKDTASLARSLKEEERLLKPSSLVVHSSSSSNDVGGGSHNSSSGGGVIGSNRHKGKTALAAALLVPAVAELPSLSLAA